MLLYLGTLRQLKHLLGQHSPFYQKVKGLNLGEREPLIIESTFDGVQIKTLQSLKPSEALASLRLEAPKKILAKGIETLTPHLGKPYDFDFDMTNDESFYCSEVLYPVFLAWGLEPILEEGELRTLISPDAMLKALLDPKLPHRFVHFLFYVESQEGAAHTMSKKELIVSLL